MRSFVGPLLALPLLAAAGVSAAGGQEPADVIPAELAILFMGGGMGDFEGPLELYVGDLPAEALADIPIPPGGEILGGSVRRRGTTVFVEVAGSAGSIRAAYLDSLEAGGWTMPESPPPWGGFQMPRSSVNTMACRGEDLYLNFTFRELNPSTARLRLVFTRSTGPNPCRMRMAPQEFDQRFPLPQLFLPEDARVIGVGGSGGGPSRGTNTTIETDRPLADLVALFERQLMDHGWTSVSRDAGDDFVFHSWTYREDGRLFYGTLIAITHPATPREHFIAVRVTPTER